jgi:hypothetical protein
MGFLRGMNHDQMFYWDISGGNKALTLAITFFHSTRSIFPFIAKNDPVYDSIAEEFLVTPTENEAKRLFSEADLYAFQQHWAVHMCPVKNYTFYQPYLKGYSGEILWLGQGWNWARMWIDHDLKASMGH